MKRVVAAFSPKRRHAFYPMFTGKSAFLLLAGEGSKSSLAHHTKGKGLANPSLPVAEFFNQRAFDQFRVLDGPLDAMEQSSISSERRGRGMS